MDLLNKAQRLLEKAEELDMVEHEGEEVPAFAADGKGPKDEKKDKKKCPECEGEGDDCKCNDEDEGPEDDGDDDIKLEKGKKCPECGQAMNKMGCKMGGCGSMKKAEPGFSTTFGFEPQNIMFASESGGQSSSVTFDGLSGQLTPHDGGGADRQVQGESLTKQQIAQSRTPTCPICHGNAMTGCLKGFGPTCRGLQG